MTSANEAAIERAAIMEYVGGLPREDADKIAQLAAVFYEHLFGAGIESGCCNGRHGIYCKEGQRLRDEYYAAAVEYVRVNRDG